MKCYDQCPLLPLRRLEHVAGSANRPKITTRTGGTKANCPRRPYRWSKDRTGWLQQCRCCTRDEPNGFVSRYGPFVLVISNYYYYCMPGSK